MTRLTKQEVLEELSRLILEGETLGWRDIADLDTATLHGDLLTVLAGYLPPRAVDPADPDDDLYSTAWDYASDRPIMPAGVHAARAAAAGPVITLVEWGRQRGLARRLVTDWAARGLFSTAYQVGETWLISANEPIPPQPYGAAAKAAREREKASRQAAAPPASGRARKVAS